MACAIAAITTSRFHYAKKTYLSRFCLLWSSCSFFRFHFFVWKKFQAITGSALFAAVISLCSCLSVMVKMIKNYVLHRDRIVKPPTQRAVKGCYWEPIIGGRLCGDGVPTLWVVWKLPQSSSGSSAHCWSSMVHLHHASISRSGDRVAPTNQMTMVQSGSDFFVELMPLLPYHLAVMFHLSFINWYVIRWSDMDCNNSCTGK